MLSFDAERIRSDAPDEIHDWDPADTCAFMLDLSEFLETLIDSGLVTVTAPLVAEVQLGEHGDDDQYLETVVVLSNGLGLASAEPLPTNTEVVGDRTGADAVLAALAHIDAVGDRLLGLLAQLR
ncbi:MAG: hypothetical protein HOV79_15620 [Hamadaea sp.]|nr:hypothetical protein [Hamadaea sp.]